MNGRGKKVSININGKKVRARKGEFLLHVARREGIDIPSLCAIEGLAPYAACRLCIVKVIKGGRERVVTSCNYPVEAGIRVITGDKKIKRLRKITAALLLSMAPASEKIKKIAAEMGVDRHTFRVMDKDNRCIHCGLCVQVCGEVVGAHAVTFANRGKKRKVTLPFGEYDLDACTGCGACSFVCPTDCINMEWRKLKQLRSRWQEGERVCRYSLMGLLPGALCDNDYDCPSCVLDRRMFELAQGMHPAFLLRKE